MLAFLTNHSPRFRSLGSPLSFAKHPGPFVAHTFFFIFTGVTAYCVADAALNPLHKDEDRVTEALSGTYSSAIGSCTAWFEPYVAPTIAGVTGQGFANGWVGGALLPATLAYATVKGVGWYDWGNSGLNDLEMKINGLKTGGNLCTTHSFYQSIHPFVRPSIFPCIYFSLFSFSFFPLSFSILLHQCWCRPQRPTLTLHFCAGHREPGFDKRFS